MSITPEMIMQVGGLLAGAAGIVWRTSTLVGSLKSDLATMRLALENRLDLQQQSLATLREELKHINDRTAEMQRQMDALRERVIVLEHGGGQRG